MSEPTPELRWAPIEPKPKSKGRVWLIIALVMVGLAIVGALVFFLLLRGAGPTPGVSETPTTTSGPTPTTSTTPEPSMTPSDTPPPATDPTIETFRAQVGGWLGDAGRGLDIVAGSGGQDALSVIDTLQEDAQRLSDAQPPSSIATQWRDGVSAYVQKLAELRTVVTADSGTSAAIDAARNAAANLNALTGL
ncbi:hypothetical protein [Microbacterium sp. NPDC091662]|uniref:hypothetical protein n=1 Tax=Microbacterium sp. NPDC091662 TaxID=3364211 RepID=UPI0037F1BC2F